VHGINEEQTICEICHSEDSHLRRIPQMTYIVKPETDSAKRVRQAIEDNRKILKEAKETQHDS
jgi:hypothetical protein